MNKRQRINSLKRIIALLIILFFVLIYKESIGQEFETFMVNYYLHQNGVNIEEIK